MAADVHFQGYLAADKPCSRKHYCGSDSFRFMGLWIFIIQVNMSVDLLYPDKCGCGSAFSRCI